jgi:hypothetical protein
MCFEPPVRQFINQGRGKEVEFRSYFIIHMVIYGYMEIAVPSLITVITKPRFKILKVMIINQEQANSALF